MPRIIDVPTGKKAYVDVPSPTGKKGWSARTKTFAYASYGSKTAARQAAEEWIADQQKARRRGTWLDPAAQRILVRDLWTLNVDTVLDGLRPNVRRNYISAYKNYIGPQWGVLRIDQLKPSDLDRLKRTMSADGLRPSTQNTVISAVSRLLAFAVRDRRIEINFASHPGTRVRDPKPAQRKPITIGVHDVSRIAHGADQMRLGYGDFVRVAFWTCARAQEIWALRVGDVKFDGPGLNHVLIQRAWSGTNENGRVLEETKTGGGRVVPVFKPLVPVLERLTHGRQPEEWLFAGTRGQAVWHSNWRTVVCWTLLVAHFDYPGLRVHDLRHSGITYLLDVGIPVHTVMRMAGHSSLRTTLLYTHGTDSALVEAAQLVEKAIDSDLTRTKRSDRVSRSA